MNMAPILYIVIPCYNEQEVLIPCAEGFSAGDYLRGPNRNHK